MWEISEGDNKLLYDVKLVPPKDLQHNPLNILFIVTLFAESTGIMALSIDKYVFACKFVYILQAFSM